MKKDNQYNFIFQNEKGEKINCELLFDFYVKEKNKNYMIFTDNTYDDNHNLVVYAYYKTDSDETLFPVIDKDEYNMVNEVYETVLEKVN